MPCHGRRHPNGDEKFLLGNCINFSVPNVDAEAFMLTTKDLISVSNGSACTSSTYEPSHVIKAMTNDEDKLKGAVRVSWCHLTENKIPVEEIKERLKKLTNDAFKKNIFGAPTYVVNNKNFWGQDRFEFAIEELKFIHHPTKYRNY